MNPVFQKLLADPSSVRPFLQWYNDKYKDIQVFQNLPFPHQIGVYIEYFETIYNLVIMVNTKGYTIHFSDNRKVPLKTENNLVYNHHKYTHEEPKSVIYGYELGITWLFKNYDLPF